MKEAIHLHHLADTEIQSDEEFDERYEMMSEIFHAICEETFERPPPPAAPRPREMSREERHARHAIKLCNNAQKALAEGKWKRFWHGTGFVDKEVLKDCARLPPEEVLPKIEALLKASEAKATKLELDALGERAKAQFEARVAWAIKTGSVKRMSPNQAIRIPPILMDKDNPGQYVDEEKQYMEVWRKHFQKLYQRDEPPAMDKPWMSTPASQTFKRTTAANPFQWPVPMTVADLRSVLRRGNDTPAPGPEDWEKWALLHSGDDWLAVLAPLANYIIQHNYFPPAIKGNYIVPLYKKGDILDPGNYRGIVLANTLQITVTSWFNRRFMKYLWDMRIIPDTQIAAQSGARVSDMTNLLNAMDGYAKHLRLTAFALKRDQKKGFDYMHRSGFRDAVEFFGLPQSVLDFDTTRNTDIELRVKCRQMLSEPFNTSGLTKQGDSMSPIKYVLVMAMAQYWLQDTLPNVGLLLKTPLSQAKRHNWHTPVDDMSLVINLVLAMDDTILIGMSVPDLQRLTTRMETFQAAYNMETEWEKPDKTTAFLIGHTGSDKRMTKAKKSTKNYKIDQKKFTSQASSSSNSGSSPSQTPGDAAVEGNGDSALSSATSITLTLPDGREVSLPISRDRRFLQTPINAPDAHSTDIERIVQAFNIPRPGQKIPITALIKIAAVTLGGKVLPRLQAHPMTRRRAKGLITIVNNKIQDYYEHPLGASPQVLVAPVNQGGLGFPDFAKLNAVWSIAGLHRCLNSKNETFRNAFTIMHSSMQCFGIRSHRCYLPFAAPVVTWSKDNGPRTNNFLTWEIAREYIIDLGLSIVPAWDDGSSEEQHNSKSNHRQKFEEGLSLDLETQQLLQDLVDDLEEVEIDPKDYKMIWATDGSTDDAKPLEARRTGFAVVGPINFSAKLGDRLATIQDAEVTAIAVAMTLDSLIRERFELPADLKSVIYSDHLNTIRRLADSKTLEGIVVQPHLPSRHALRWLQEAAIANPDMEMVHQKSHTDERSEAARLNAAADKAAKEARDSNITLRIPAYHADLYCLYHPETGVSHAHVPTFLRHVWEKQHRNEIEVSGDVLRYQEKRLFTTAISASSAKTAMLTRSNTLGTPVRMRHSGREPRTPHCALCAADSRQIDEHHIFVSCSGVQRMRERQYNEVAKAIDAHAEKSDDWTAEDTATHVELADSLFFDCDMWGSGRTNFWKGALPKHFAYKEGHDALYNKIAGICTRTAAMIWNKHLAAEY